MPRFTITHEATEDILATADNLPDAVRAAKEVALAGPVGELVLVESSGFGLRQFIKNPDGTIEERETAPFTASSTP